VVPINTIRYNVYRDLGQDPLGAPAAPPTPWNDPAPAPLNPMALDTTTFTDEVQFGRERCYTVRALFGTGRAAVESGPSTRVCVTPIDVFPPAAPAQPATVAGEGAITLIWEPNREPDVAGYLVLRGEPGDATLRPLTPTPIADTSYRDVTVMQGRRYLYAVVAVDNRAPLPNASVPSASVEETAR
jgi:fibronectin type 3 domain-containing protein